MAIIETRGRVEAIKVSDTAGWFRMLPEGAQIQDWFFLWVATPETPYMVPDSKHLAQLSLLRDAFTNGRIVTVTHEEESSRVDQLAIGIW
jgi:hypothetical protein